MTRPHRSAIPQLVRPAAAFAIVILCGAIGYEVIEGWPWIDALYESVTIVSTVGLMEVQPLSTAGRVFTMVLELFGVGTFMYTVTTLTNYVITGELRGYLEQRRMDKRVAALQDHYIICGFGRMGQQVAREFVRERHSFVIVDRQPEAMQRATELGYIAVTGDSGDDNVLRGVAIERARGLVSAIDDDAMNLMVVLSARALNERLFIVARANNQLTESKLLSAGANRVLWPYGVSGRRMAQMALRPHVVEFLEVVMHEEEVQLWLEELTVGIGSPLDGVAIGAGAIREKTGAMIVAVRRAATGKMEVAPSPDLVLAAGDIAVALGTREQLGRFRTLAGQTQ